MWDNPKWGWQSQNIHSSLPLISAKDIYVANIESHSEQKVFEDFSQLRIAMVNGYHYRFADFETDNATLNKRFNINMVRTEQDALKMVLTKRVDITTISTTSLGWFLKQNPQYEEQLLVSEKFDTAYQRFFLIPTTSIIDAQQLNKLLIEADNLDLLAPIYANYGLTKPDFADLVVQ